MTENQDNQELNKDNQADITDDIQQDNKPEPVEEIAQQPTEKTADDTSADEGQPQIEEGNQNDGAADEEQPSDQSDTRPESFDRDYRKDQSDKRGKKSAQKGGKKPDKYRKHILCRYGKMGNIGYFAHDLEDFPDKASHVIVNTDRGLEIAQIMSHDTCHKKGNCTIKESQINKYCKDSCDNFPLDKKGSIVRLATEQDVREQQHLEDGVAKELNYCNQLVAEQNLEMTLIDAERLFGGERIIFYFMADGRVDFRQLVKDLAQQYQTRIEMRQIGARDEARLVADFETCGRECCCRSFLKVLYPVNMRMAKLQKATLDPSKISGRCGRLKCCLRFEDEVYNEHKKKLPKKNSIVLTKEGHGKVIDTHVLTLLVKVFLTESSRLVVVDLEDIEEFNYVPPVKPEKTEEEIKEENNRNNRSRNKKRNGNNRPSNGNNKRSEDDRDKKDSDQSQQDDNNGGSESSGDDAENKPKKKRRRRRRKKKPSADGQNNSGDSDGPKQSNDGGDGGGDSGKNE